MQSEIYRKNGVPDVYPYEALESLTHYLRKHQHTVRTFFILL